MPRPRLVPTLLAFAAAMALFEAPVWPASLPSGMLEHIQAAAQHEGLPCRAIGLGAARVLVLETRGPIARDTFLKRASLVAYYVFDQLHAPLDRLDFGCGEGAMRQHCQIKRADYVAYLHDRISKAEYERRLAYAGPTLAPVPIAHHEALPPIALASASAPALPELPLAHRQPIPFLSAPVPGHDPLLGFAYGVGLGNGAFDGYAIEYGQPILPTLDLRPSLQILSPFSPINFMAGAGRPVSGASIACDLLGTTRQQLTSGGLAFDGGLGARLATLDGAGGNGLYPAMHLRVGLHWNWLALTMRYPLLHRGDDPTASWETTLGLSIPFSQLLGPQASAAR